MLQPVTIVPSAVSSAAPTLKLREAPRPHARGRVGRRSTRSTSPARSRSRRGPSRRSLLPAIAFGPTQFDDPAIEAGAAVGLDARAALVEHQADGILAADAVDDMGDARDLVEPRGQHLDFGVAVALLGGGGVVPVAHGVEAQRMRFVADHLGAPVLLADEERLEVRRQRQELRFVPFADDR